MHGTYVQIIKSYNEKQWSKTKTVLIVLGANDLIKGVSIQKTLIKYKALVNVIRARLGDINIVCATLPPRIGLKFELGLEFNKGVSHLAKVLHVKAYQLHKPFVLGRTAKAAYYLDGLNFDKPGLMVVVKAIKLLKSQLYL